MTNGGSLSKVLLFLLVLLQAAAISAAAQTNGGGGSSSGSGWIRVRSKNFELVGNADEQSIRQVAGKLEQFREGLRQVLDRFNFNSPVPTTVIVFKTAADYRPFKPLRADGGGPNDIITGYFQASRDANYITLSTEAEISRSYEIIFHEYTHFLVRNNVGESRIPPWFGEGLSIYYETFAVENDLSGVTLGGAPPKMLQLLRQHELIPFEKFFAIDQSSVHEQGKEGVGLFYAQAWALTHYLKHGAGGARSAQLDKFLSLTAEGRNSRDAFAEAFRAEPAALEAELRNYLARGVFPVSRVPLRDKLVSDAEMSSTPLPNAEVKAYLGDLLMHANRLAEAEVYLREALAEQPGLSRAQTSYGLLKVKRGDFVAARELLEKAVESDAANYFVHFAYAYALSREGMTDFGFIVNYDRDAAEKMRRSLKKSISLNPDYAESYDLYAFVCIVRNELLDEAAEYLNKALEIAPGNQWYLIHLSEVFLRQEDFVKAKTIASKVTQTAGDKELKVYAFNTLNRILSTEAAYEDIKNSKDDPPGNPLDVPMTDEELARVRARQMMESLNESLYRTRAGEKRVLGYLTEIDCQPREMVYTVRTGNQVLRLRSPSFDSVRFVAFSAEMAQTPVGCGGLKNALAVVNYRPSPDARGGTSGEVVSVEFVPANFKFIQVR